MSQGTLMHKKTEEIYSLFVAPEGFNYVYYGKIRNGKTYAATADILDLLNRGEIVYANWKIDWKGFDERSSLPHVIVKTIFNKKYFYDFKPKNFHYLDVDDPDFILHLNKLVGVHIFIDEGQWIFNSHLKTDDVDKRRLILEGGHYCRSLSVITQRPTNILKDVRSQVHVWYKCQKVLSFGGFIRFVRWEIEDMKDDVPIDPDEMKKKPPSKAYWASKRVFEVYDTHARRGKDAIEEPPEFDVYEYTVKQKLQLIASLAIPERVRGRLARLRERPVPQKPIPTVKNKTRWSLGDLKEPK